MSGIDGAAEAGWVEVHRGGDRDRWLELALVLEAVGVRFALDSRPAYRILVPGPEVARARWELAEYEAEALADEGADPGVVQASGAGFVPGYWLVLVAVSALDQHRAFGLDWLRAGRANSRLILAGEWWRTITALTLHADGAHLLNNLVFGSFFGVMLAYEVGAGWAWLAMALSGALGNGLNAYLHGAGHWSIGASTGVFGTVGLLMGLQSRRPGSAQQSRWRRLAPPVVGMVFLGMLGTSGERTDVLAHVTGAAFGMALGWGLGGQAHRHRLAARTQWAPTTAALLMVAGAWWLALRG